VEGREGKTKMQGNGKTHQMRRLRRYPKSIAEAKRVDSSGGRTNFCRGKDPDISIMLMSDRRAPELGYWGRINVEVQQQRDGGFAGGQCQREEFQNWQCRSSGDVKT
jgi:hypothetical protein